MPSQDSISWIQIYKNLVKGLFATVKLAKLVIITDVGPRTTREIRDRDIKPLEILLIES